MDIDSCSRSRPSFTFEDDAVLGGPHLYAHLSRSMMQWIDSIIHCRSNVMEHWTICIPNHGHHHGVMIASIRQRLTTTSMAEVHMRVALCWYHDVCHWAMGGRFE